MQILFFLFFLNVNFIFPFFLNVDFIFPFFIRGFYFHLFFSNREFYFFLFFLFFLNVFLYVVYVVHTSFCMWLMWHIFLITCGLCACFPLMWISGFRACGSNVFLLYKIYEVCKATWMCDKPLYTFIILQFL